MSDTLGQDQPVASTSTFVVEHVHTVLTGNFKTAIKISDMTRVAVLRTMFASVQLVNVVAEITQDTLLGSEESEIASNGHIFIGLIPTSKNADALAGANAAVVCSVPNKQTFPMETGAQSTKTFSFLLDGYEIDLAQDPRRGAGPVAWIGNSGVTSNGRAVKQICTVTWRMTLQCVGATVLW